MSNLLYSQGKLQVADFGLSRPYAASSSSRLTPEVASLWYRPPEVLLFGKQAVYSETIDTWAAGCIFAELLKGYPLLDGKTELDQIHKIIQCIGLVKEDEEWFRRDDLAFSFEMPSLSSRTLLDDFSYLSINGLRLLTSLLDYNPKLRWSASTALASPYFEELPLPCPVNKMPHFT